MNIDQVYTENSIRTFTGKVFDAKILDPDSICIEDIAHALSMQTRFGGHLKVPYTIAQHCVLVAQCLIGTGFELEGLLHDASEAYICDIPKPIKALLPDYVALEGKITNVIENKFGLNNGSECKKLIKQADIYLLEREWDGFIFDVKPFEAWGHVIAEGAFLRMYYELTKERNNVKENV